MESHFSNIGEMIQNLSASMPLVLQMVTAIAFVMGLYFMVAGVGKFKALAQSQAMSSSTIGHIKGPMLYLMVGAILLYLPSSTQMGFASFFGSTSVLAYPAGQALSHQIVAAVITIVRVIGMIAFIRGWVLVTHMAGQQAAPNAFSKAVTHIIGGIFAMNIYQVWELLRGTLIQ